MERFHIDHLPGTVDLLTRSFLPEDAAEAREIVELLRPRDERRTTGFAAMDGARVIGVAFAAVSHADPKVGHLDLLAVDPGHRRRGLGTELIAQAEQGLRELGCEVVRVAGNPPDYAFPGVDVRYTPAICALTKAGYAHERTAWNMTAELRPGSKALADTSAAEARLADQGVEVRVAEANDIARLRPIIAAEWGGHWAAEITSAQAVHIAEKDGEPIAFAAWGCTRPGWFGPMGTRPAAKGLGIGSVLLRRCLADQAKAGVTRAQIGWVGPVPFYAQAADAYIERVFFLYSKDL
ncbi:MAG: GNAT family N-acetyltransferase [Hamadaea sp.]|uniref:GNAT family N-acetyltransferase n=1 Tax=Hamadaea sp. TaxID=2024425 RepID=UPI001853B13D|nr:GNAT family N-acetyltransferase [Hamadaea sp.]NUR73640.1 GNAT family N-acetyltransferase [Hamadaea sp.]NUT20355.1 GNAT family N-acetyltransferase [Hamadaea sp.]